MRDGFETQLVGGIGSVGDQLAQEDLAIAVERMNHEVKQLLHLGLEAVAFPLCHVTVPMKSNGSAPGVAPVGAALIVTCGRNFKRAADGVEQDATERRNSDRTETIALCQEAGGEAAWQACDVTSAEAQDALVGNVVRSHGRLDFAVNNAGVAVHKPLTEVTDQEYSRVLDINLKGIYLGMRPQVRQMAEQGGGSIVNMGVGRRADRRARHRGLSRPASTASSA